MCEETTTDQTMQKRSQRGWGDAAVLLNQSCAVFARAASIFASSSSDGRAAAARALLAAACDCEGDEADWTAAAAPDCSCGSTAHAACAIVPPPLTPLSSGGNVLLLGWHAGRPRDNSPLHSRAGASLCARVSSRP